VFNRNGGLAALLAFRVAADGRAAGAPPIALQASYSFAICPRLPVIGVIIISSSIGTAVVRTTILGLDTGKDA
jgi:hypothetical protein